jgi:hypothetical protein
MPKTENRAKFDIELVDGYKILHAKEQSVAEIEYGLVNGAFEGLSLNAYAGWTGTFCDLLRMSVAPKALLVPFGDLIGFDAKCLRIWGALQMLLLSEFSGEIHFESANLRILRVLVTGRMRFVALPNLELLYMRKSADRTIESLVAKAPRLQILELNAGRLKTLAAIVHAFPYVTRMELVNIRTLTDIADIKQLKSLHSLTLKGTKKIERLEKALTDARTLRILKLIDCSPLEELIFLRSLNLEEFKCIGTPVKRVDEPALQRIPNVYIGERSQTLKSQ